jgi:hypothetical protein
VSTRIDRTERVPFSVLQEIDRVRLAAGNKHPANLLKKDPPFAPFMGSILFLLFLLVAGNFGRRSLLFQDLARPLPPPASGRPGSLSPGADGGVPGRGTSRDRRDSGAFPSGGSGCIVAGTVPCRSPDPELLWSDRGWGELPVPREPDPKMAFSCAAYQGGCPWPA